MRQTVVIRGAGDIASGIGHRLFMSGFNVLMLDIENPLVIRRKVSFADAIINGEAKVEGVSGILCKNAYEAQNAFKEGKIAVMVDEKCNIVNEMSVDIVVDAILAKKNLGTNKKLAPIVIGVGPGFSAGDDVDVVVETIRGHYLGRVILSGEAEKDTKEPGSILGYTHERVIKSHKEGVLTHVKDIGDIVKAGETIAKIDGSPVKSKLDGALRGLIKNNTYVKEGLKIGDVDPRGNREYCTLISEKARAVAGGVLEAILYYNFRR